MLPVAFCWRWVQCGAVLTTMIPGITANSQSIHFSNSSSPTSSSTGTSTSMPHSSITSCANASLIDYLPSSLRSLPSSVLEPLVLSEAVRLQEVIRSFARYNGLPATAINPEVFLQLVSIFTSVQHEVASTLGSSGYAYLNFPGFTDPCLLSTCVNQFIAQGSSATAANPSGLWIYQAQPPCCGTCSIYANNVELAYWPTPAPTPPITALVNKNNFTYVSPSVYAFFTNLGASDNCGPVGGVYYPTLDLKFGPTDLSTSSIPVNPSLSLTFNSLGQWTAINYADFGPQCICTANCPFDPILNTTLVNLCTPQLSIPHLVTELVPAWATCDSDFLGAFDPPIALGLAAGLTTPKDTPAQPTPGGGSTTSPGPTAAPVSSPNPPVVAPTPAPQPTTPANPTPPSQSNNPPSPPINSQPANPQPINSPPANPQPINSPPSNPQSANSPSPAPAPVQQSFAVPVIPAVPSPITIANTVLTPAPGTSSLYIINSQALVPGGSAVTVNGVAISLPPSGPAITVNSPAPTPLPALTINGQTITANTQTNFVIGIQTLVPGGPAITVSGTVISLAPGATQVVVGGTTTPLGSIIMSVFNGDTGTSSSANPSGTAAETSGEGSITTGVAPAEFTGAAVRTSVNVVGRALLLVILSLLALI